MGMRFRKSIKIAPGVRINIGKTGFSSLTMGKRGATVSVGRRGTYANVGVPGPGLSFRERIDGAITPTQRSSRGAYRELLQIQKELERESARLEAKEQHEEHSERINRLRSLLSEREPLAFDPARALRNEEQFTRSSFEAEPLEPGDYDVSEQARSEVPTWPWATGGVFFMSFLVAVRSADSTLLIVLLGGTAVLLFSGWAKARARQMALVERLANDARIKREAMVRLQKDEHEANEHQREAEWEANQKSIQVLLNRLSDGDVDAWALMLEQELANEELPLPLVFELDMNGLEEVRIELALPAFSEVPEEVTRLTKTGKLSFRKMAKRDRIGIYQDLCCGLALRLVHETFRVLSAAERVEIFGTVERVDPSTGHEGEILALHANITRSRFSGLNLDSLAPYDALKGLGGRFGKNRNGQMEPIPGASGLVPALEMLI